MRFVVRDVEIFDGTGTPSCVGDVAVDGDRIVDGIPAGAVEIDGRGYALAPGFIDVHSHDDFAVLADPLIDCKIAQGVTTDIVGNCGFGAAPYDAGIRMLGALVSGGSASLPSWEGYRGYLAAIDIVGPASNVAVLAGHSTIRLAAMGFADREPSNDELEHMQASVQEAIDAGVVGLSSGLIYEPGRYARTDELVALASVMRGSGALYASHIRNEGEMLLDAVAEAISIGEQAGVAVQISHHKAAGRDNWGRVRDSLALMDAARARGVDVTADQYPYTASSTALHAFARVSRAGEGPLEPDLLRLASAPHHPEWEGLTLAGIAELLHMNADDAVDHVLAEERQGAIAILESMCEDDVRTVLAHPTTMIGTDGLPSNGKPHPRLYGTFPRVLGRYARDEGVLPLATAIHRMTGFPSEKFSLRDRGVVAPGAFADLVLFDSGSIADTATYEDPRRYPSGVKTVWVNGEVVVQDGQPTGARAGRALRRGV